MKGKDKMYQIKLMAKGVNYIEMWMDKERLDEIGEENIDTEYFEDNLINGEKIIDISGIIVESGFKIKIYALDTASKEPEIIDGNDHMKFIEDSAKLNVYGFKIDMINSNYKVNMIVKKIFCFFSLNII